jgi:phage/plasmid-associated DNA primase
MTTETLNIARLYHDLGFSVVPLEARKKAPEPSFVLSKYFRNKANIEEIQEWFTQNPHRNIGIVTGAISRAFAVDVDGDSGKRYLESRMTAMSPNLRKAIENTMCSKTGKGLHFIFQFNPEEFPNGLTTKKLWTDPTQEHSEIMMKGEGGYIVAPPSIHPETGLPYELSPYKKQPYILTKTQIEELQKVINSKTAAVESALRENLSETSGDEPDPTTYPLIPERMSKLIEVITPFYTPGQRNSWVFELSGWLRKEGHSKASQITFWSMVCERTRDVTEKASRLNVVQKTYQKPPKLLRGFNGVYNQLKLQLNDNALEVERVLNVIKSLIVDPNKSAGRPTSLLSESERIKIQEKDDDEDKILQWTWDVLDHFDIVCSGPKEKLYIYQNGVYVAEDAEQIIELYLEGLNRNIKSKDVSEVLEKIRRLTYRNERSFDSNPFVINFSNCWYNWLEDKTFPHSPAELSRQQLPYPYPEKKTLPKHFYKFMLGIHYPNEVKTAMDWMAYTFLNENRFELTCFKIGYGKNGKTTEDNLTKALHGAARNQASRLSKRVTGFSLKQIQESEFATSQLVESWLNIDAETDGKPIDMTELKRLTSKDTLHQVQSKGIDFQGAYLHTKFQLNFNKPPILTNQSDGDIRRLLMLSYPNQFEGKNDDVDLSSKLQSPEELSAIFSWVIAPALRRLYKARSIHTDENTIEKQRLRYELVSNPIKAATDAIITPATVDDFAAKHDTYNAYKKFCAKKKLPVLSMKKFGQYMIDTLKITDGRRGPKNGQVEVWIGIRLNPEYTVEQGQIQLTEA